VPAAADAPAQLLELGPSRLHRLSEKVDGCRLPVPWDYFTVARQNEAARAADATACMDTIVGTALLKNGWRRRWDDADGWKPYIDEHQ
jgi:hypothetical protein